MSQAAFWAGIFTQHEMVCGGALHGAEVEQFADYSIFKVTCHVCGFTATAGVQLADGEQEWEQRQVIERGDPGAAQRSAADSPGLRRRGEVSGGR